MKKTSIPSTDDSFDRFTQQVYKQIAGHGVEAGYHTYSGPNLLFEFIKDFDPCYRHPIGEAISKLKELAKQLDSGGPMTDWLENLQKVGAWAYLVHADIERSYLGPTQNRAGGVVDTERPGCRPPRP